MPEAAILATDAGLVLAGKCRAIVEGMERELSQWSYLPCPPNTPHVIVGAGEEPCVIAMIAAPRTASLEQMDYPENETAARFGASISRSTNSSREAYADRGTDAVLEPARGPLR
jgi:glyoxylate utilization-related uncharacterized protein